MKKIPNKDNNVSEYLTKVRLKLGVSHKEIANLLGMPESGERTVRGWESGEHYPTKSKLEAILRLEDDLDAIRAKAPFVTPTESRTFKFIDLFAGIGGIRLPFQKLGGECVFTSEWDKFAQKTYIANYGEVPNGDITKIKSSEIPPHDILLGGFPCQAFSQAGLKKGFNDTRGTMFFEIQRILVSHRPKAFLLENVKQLKGHDKGRTLQTIIDILTGKNEVELPDNILLPDETRHALSDKLNYSVDFKVLRAGDFGVPQNRERIFIVGFDKNHFGEDFSIKEHFNWPEPTKEKTSVGKILEDFSDIPENEDRYTISEKLWAGHQRRKLEHKNKGNGFGYSLFDENSEYTSTISARYYKDGSEILIDQSKLGKNPRKLTPKECAKLQGFPEDFIVDAVSHGQIYKQFGNSVCMTVIEKVADQMLKTIKTVEATLTVKKKTA